MISGGKTSDEAEAEFLYFRLYNSYLLQKPELRTNYDMLLDLYQRNPASFSILSKNDLIRLKRVQDDIKNNRFSLFGSDLAPIDLNSDLGSFKKTDKRHIEVCLDLVQNKSLLEPFTGPIDFMNLEHPVMFGFIDLLVKSRETAYIVEVKTEAADHSIAGQVEKYFIGLSLTLSRKWCDDIRIICVCPGYDRSAITLVNQIGATALVYSHNPFELKKL